MAVITFTIRATGGSYSLLSTAVAAESTNLVAAGDSHVYEMYNDWPSGLVDNTAFVGYTTGPSNTVTITSPPSERHDGIDLTTGFYFNNASVNTLRPISTCNHMVIEWLGFLGGLENLSTANGGLENATIQNNIIKDNVSGDMIFGIGARAIPNATIINNILINPADDGMVLDALTVSNNTIINSGNRGIVSLAGTYENNFVFGSTGVDYSNQGGSLNFNASEDATAPGATNYRNRTQSDFANFAGADYRTSSSSALATGGSGGTFIGYALESGGGISVNEQLKNINVSTLNPTVTLTSSISVIEQTSSVSYSALNPVVTLTGVISVAEQVKNVQFGSNNPVIDLTGVVSIVEQTSNYTITSNNPSVTLTPKPIEITEQAVSLQYQSLNPSILLTPEPIGIVSTVCFPGCIKELIFNGQNIELLFDGDIKNTVFNGDLKDLEFNGTIKQSCTNGKIKTDC